MKFFTWQQNKQRLQGRKGVPKCRSHKFTNYKFSVEGEKYKLFTPLVTLQKDVLNVLNKKFRITYSTNKDRQKNGKWSTSLQPCFGLGFRGFCKLNGSCLYAISIPFPTVKQVKNIYVENYCLMLILSFNGIPSQIFRHCKMITESHPFVSFGKQVEFNNSEEGKMEVWSSNIIS